ncbi:MAG: hypothetical protein E7641_06195 [Ruminococcaceae bacterium]|nr:hypothetical protein [Oscillospiraceae bacterium]
MGFGILFFGYFITYLMAMNPWGCFFRAFGYLMMCSGIMKLTQYNKNFTYSVYASFLLGLINICFSVVEIYDMVFLSPSPFGETFMKVITNLETGTVLIFHLLLLFAVRSIAKETESDKIAFGAIRNLIFVVAYFLLSFIKFMPFEFVKSYNRNMTLPLFLLYLGWIVMDLVLLFSCYSGICDENDREMKRKPSRFEFINQYREELDAREAKAMEFAEKNRAERAKKKKKK